MRVLVAGDGGYIGAVLVPFLQRAGHEVHGLDLGLYAGCDLGPAQGGARSPGFVDMRDVTAAQLTGYDAVLCLAALSNDPLGDLNPAATYSVNLDGTMNLARMAKEAGVPRFLFSSSCSLYGSAGWPRSPRTRTSFPSPRTERARSKQNGSLRCSRTTASALPTCGTRPRTVRPRGCAWTSW